MNNDMQAIMKRRRRMAEEDKGNQNEDRDHSEGSMADHELEASGSDLQGSRSHDSNTSGFRGFDANASLGSAMSSDLQAIMERRRRLADGEDPNGRAALSPAAIKEDLKNVEMSPDLQAIMARRRGIADDKKDDISKSSHHSSAAERSGRPPPPPPPPPLVPQMEEHGHAHAGSDQSSVDPPPPPPPPLVPQMEEHGHAHAGSDQSSAESDHSTEVEQKVVEVEQVQGKRSNSRSSHKRSSKSNSSSPRKSRSSRKEEVVEEIHAPLELDIDDDSEDEEDSDDEPDEAPAPKQRPRSRRATTSTTTSTSTTTKPVEKVEESSSRRKMKLPRRSEAPDLDDVSIDVSVDQSVQASVDSKESSRSGDIASTPKSSSRRSAEKPSSASTSRSREDRGESSRSKQSRRRSTHLDVRPPEKEEDKHKRRSRRASTTGSSSGGTSGRRSTTKRDASTRSFDSSHQSIESLDDGGSTPTASRRSSMPRKPSTRSFESSDDMPDEVEEDKSMPLPTGSSQRKTSKKKRSVKIDAKAPAEVAAPAGWGDFPQAAEKEMQSTGFSGGFSDFSGGMDFGASVANFDFAPPPVETQEKPGKTDPFTADPTFDASFSPAPGFEANAFAVPSAFESAFDQPSLFSPAAAESAAPESAPTQKTWDSSPLTGVPKTKPPMLSLVETTAFPCQFQGAPVTNPLNGNIIFCSTQNDTLFIHEVDPHRDYVQVSSVAVLSPELQHKLASKYNASAHSVDSVITLTAGLHRVHGQTRVRVAAVLDFNVLETEEVMRTVAVWQWGYGSPHPVLLQYVMAPPNGGEFSYDVGTLQLADGLLFIAGTSPKGPCVFMSKPAVRETWSANFLTAGKGRISAMAVTPDYKRSFPYLAVALTDKTLSVWTYTSALSSAAPKANDAAKKWLYPLCQLEGLSILAKLPATPLEASSSSKDVKDAGHCTHLAWLPPQPSMSHLQMLSASFQNGLAIFHIALPVLADRKNGCRPFPAPTSATLLSQTPALNPIVANRWQGRHDRAFSSWVNLGPHSSPGLALLLHESDSTGGSARIVFGCINIPLYWRGPMPKDRLNPFCILASSSVAKGSGSYPLRLLGGSALKAAVCHAAKGIVLMSPSTSSIATDAAMISLSYPISSNPPGLSSLGDPILTDAGSDKDGILHIFTVLNCERQKSENEGNMLDWSRPRRRHWICRTVVGDSRNSKLEETKEDRGASEFGDSEPVLGGTSSDVICELLYSDSLTGLTPFRIVRCPGAKVCAVLFLPALGEKDRIQQGYLPQASSIALVDYSGPSPVIEVVEARDISFWLKEGSTICGLLLSRDGASLTFFSWEESPKSLALGTAFRPMVGVETDESYIECRRIFTFTGASKLGLVVVGTRHSDGQSCVAAGDLCEIANINEDSWSPLLPNILTGLSMWLGKSEEVFTIVGLESDDSGYRNFAVATSKRVLILSSAMIITAQTRTTVSCIALAPLGAFAVCFCSNGKLQYLCGLDGGLVSGSIATLPLPRSGYVPNLLLGVRPDRVLLFQWHSGTRLAEPGQSVNTFLLPTAITRPVLLLEPMVANAVCIGGKQSQSTPVLRGVIEKFGRKIASITHGDDEGIGHLGAGVTPQVFEILRKYGLNQAASWLLTGTVMFDRSVNSKILPHWLPVAPKARGALNSDAFLHLVANGDQYLSDYVKAPDQSMVSTLPRRSDPAAYISQEYARDSLGAGKALDALKLLDLSGSESTESLILQLALVLQKDHSKDVTPLLKSLCGYDDDAFSRSSTPVKTPASLAALALSLKLNPSAHVMTGEQVDRWIKPLAPSLQRGTRTGRMRQKVLGEGDLAKAGAKQKDDPDDLWMSPCNESKHIWNEGPRREKDNLLMLDRVEDWLGRRRPVILGKEGASAAGDRGEKTLADILNKNDDDDDSFGGKDEGDLESEKDGWVDGVGEGRTDEANLSGYFRMSEGEDEDSPWRSEGLADLSPFQNSAVVVGDAETYSLEATTSSVDEGEPGKVKSLYDFVFQKSSNGSPSGLALAAPRGGSLDVGMLHGPDRQSRHRCTVEFWFYLPSPEEMSGEVVLARRTMGASADDLSKVCLAQDKENSLWEIVLRRSGELEFRSCGGSSLVSSKNYTPGDDDDDSDDENERKDLAAFNRWNHVCLVFSSKGLGVTKCSVSMFLKGIEAVSSEVSMLPSGFKKGELDRITALDELMQKSHLLFGLNGFAGLRFTELRVWACERSADDTSALMYEYLTAAEAKKKFKVRIKNKKGAGATLGKGPLLAGRGGGGLATPQKGSLAPKFSLAPTITKSGLSPGKISLAHKTTTVASLVPLAASLAPPKKEPASQDAQSDFFAAAGGPTFGAETTPDVTASFEAAFDAFGTQDVKPEEGGLVPREAAREEGKDDSSGLGDHDDTLDFEEIPVSLWDTALPLSQQVRSSAAAALIRGPPATRHFGGNRGGLPDYSGVERFGVGGVAICGSEKTIVYRDNEDPPALTYPIGASGAIVSDQMDDEGSEFLCCFLAKEKRMVVFELQSRTVVVELQMTTKLNFWRFLPPEASENTLCFVLVTPVGGFHWMPLEESPRPHQVWKRGPELQGKKVVGYEEGGSNGLEGLEILSRVGLVTVTKDADSNTLEAWLVPICGDSQAVIIFEDVMGACLCQPPFADDGPFLPLLVTAHQETEGIYVNVLSITEPSEGSVQLGNVEATEEVDLSGYEDIDYEPPGLAMGTSPEAICCSLANIVVVIIRRKGLIVAFELEDGDITLIASEDVGHYIIDAVMRYSAEVGGAEVVMLLADNENTKDGRMVSFCFRSAA